MPASFWYELTCMNSPSANPICRDFFSRGPKACDLLQLFEHMPSAYLYVKDRRSRFIAVNKNLLTIYHEKHADALIGKTDRDFHPPALAEAYLAEDRLVFIGKKTIANQTWLVPDVRGVPNWYVSTKTPITGADGKVIGLAGVMYPIERSADRESYFGVLAPSLRLIEQSYMGKVSVAKVAAVCGLSSTAFNRRFKQMLRMTPSEYVLALRVNAARRRLTETDKSLCVIAVECGFTDQSHFTKRFRRVTGMTPSRYRQEQ